MTEFWLAPALLLGIAFILFWNMLTHRKELKRHAARLQSIDALTSLQPEPQRVDVMIAGMCEAAPGQLRPFLWGQSVCTRKNQHTIVLQVDPQQPIAAGAVIAVFGPARLQSVYVGQHINVPFLGGGVPMTWTSTRCEVGQQITIHVEGT